VASNSLQKARKKSKRLVDFAYGGDGFPTHERLTDWTVDLSHTTGTYLSEPALEVNLAEINGTLEEKPAQILLPLTNAFADRISDGRAHSLVRARILEVTDTDGATDEMVLHVGRVSMAHRNHGGKAGVVMLESPSWKAYLNVLEGLSVDVTCDWTLFGIGCTLSSAGFTHSGILTQIDGRAVIIGGLPGVLPRYFHRGYVEKDGVRISIREWVSGTTFYLVRDPPGTWLNGVVKVVAGCDKTKPTCRSRFSNEAHFLALGYGTPAYNPTMEVG